MMNKKSGQASVEFMSTYIWVGIAILLAVGAIAYYNANFVSSFEKEECFSGNQLVCVDVAAYEDGTFALQLSNQINREIMIDRVEITSFDPPVVLDSIGLISDAYEKPTIIINSNSVVSPGTMLDFAFAVSYKTSLDGQNYTVSGRGKAIVIAGWNPNIQPHCNDGLRHPDEVCDESANPNGCNQPLIRCRSDCSSCYKPPRGSMGQSQGTGGGQT